MYVRVYAFGLGLNGQHFKPLLYFLVGLVQILREGAEIIMYRHSLTLQQSQQVRGRGRKKDGEV